MRIITRPTLRIGGVGGSEEILNTIRFLDFENLCDDPLETSFYLSKRWGKKNILMTDGARIF